LHDNQKPGEKEGKVLRAGKSYGKVREKGFPFSNARTTPRTSGRMSDAKKRKQG